MRSRGDRNDVNAGVVGVLATRASNIYDVYTFALTLFGKVDLHHLIESVILRSPRPSHRHHHEI
jgi:hypothetical protein